MYVRRVLILLALMGILLPGCTKKKTPVKPAECDCRHQGDVNGDSILTVFDVTLTLEILYDGAVDTVDASCPHVGRADVHCDCVVDSSDVNYLIKSVFAGGPRPCNPCVTGKSCR